MPDNLIPANINIADRQYRIKVSPADEQSVRHSIKLINDKVMELKKQFPGKDMQDYISMTLIWFATEFKQSASQIFDEQALLARLQALENVIDSELEK
ncbi:MAG: cell division protein ZapA [Niabella sp.]